MAGGRQSIRHKGVKLSRVYGPSCQCGLGRLSMWGLATRSWMLKVHDKRLADGRGGQVWQGWEAPHLGRLRAVLCEGEVVYTRALSLYRI